MAATGWGISGHKLEEEDFYSVGKHFKLPFLSFKKTFLIKKIPFY